MMKIAVIGKALNSLHDPYCRQTERFFLSHVKELSKKNQVVSYGAKGPSSSSSTFELLTDEDAAKVLKLQKKGHFYEAQKLINSAYLSVLQDLDDQGFDVIHNLSDEIAPLIASNRMKAIMVTTLFSSPDLDRIALLEKGSEKINSYFCAQTEAIKKEWKKAVPHLDIAHIPSGDLPSKKEVVLNLRRPDNVALWYGDIEKNCGLEDAVEACHLAGVSLMITGHMRDKGYYRSEVLPLLSNRDKYLGTPDKIDIDALMERSRVALWTKKEECPIGPKLLKILFNGIPVAAYETECLREHIHSENGQLVAMGNPGKLAQAIAKIKDLCRIKIQQRTIKTYSSAYSAARYMEIFKFLKALHEEDRKEQAYRHLRAPSWKGTLA